MVKNTPKPSSDATRTDLGDDLLQTRTILRSDPSTPPGDSVKTSRATPSAAADASPEAGVEELLVNSKIQIGEGFLDDAKVTLRRVLRIDPGNLTARDRLEDIQKTEIRRLLGQEENPRGSFLRSKKKLPESDETPESVLDSLEHEVGLSPLASEQFFRTPEELGEFLAGIDQLCAGATAQDRMDLGIGFLEMELYDVAVRQFRAASYHAESERKARGLLATALVAQKKFHDALIEIESLIADQSGTPEEKIDFGYLAGLAQEGLKNFEGAVRWYRAVVQINPEYRDAAERMLINQKKCVRTPSSSSSSSSRS